MYFPEVQFVLPGSKICTCQLNYLYFLADLLIFIWSSHFSYVLHISTIHITSMCTFRWEHPLMKLISWNIIRYFTGDARSNWRVGHFDSSQNAVVDEIKLISHYVNLCNRQLRRQVLNSTTLLWWISVPKYWVLYFPRHTIELLSLWMCTAGGVFVNTV